MPDKPIPVNKPTLAIVIFGIFVLGIVMFLYSRSNNPNTGCLSKTVVAELEYEVCVPSLSDLSTSDISLFEGNADMKFPASAREIYAYTSGFREMFTTVHFSMKASELPTFIKTTLCNKALENYIPSANEKDLKGGPYQRCFGGSKSAFQKVFVDMTNPQTYIVSISDSSP